MNTTTASSHDGVPTTFNGEKSRASDLVFALVAAIALAFVACFALSPLTPPTPADRLTLIVLALASAVAVWSPFGRVLDREANAASFLLTAAMFVVYGIARRAGPVGGFALHFSFLPDDKFVVPYVAYIVIVAAIVCAPLWWRTLGGWARAILLATILIFALALLSFRFLSGYYPVGVTETLDPTPLIQAGLQLIEYGALALVGQSAITHPLVRRWILRLLPAVLLVIWLRHQFAASPPVEADE